MILTAFEGHLFGTRNLAFLRDIESHVRFLVALPILILAELIVHRRLMWVVKSFVDRGMVVPEEMPKFHVALAAAIRARNCPWLESALLLFVFTAGHWIWQQELWPLG